MSDVPEMKASGAVALGMTACVVLLIGLLGWAAKAAIVSAVVGQGEVDVGAYRHPVQHPDGGVVDALYVREGQRVEAGELLLRLEGTALATELDFVEVQIREGEARLVRWRAERDGAGFPVLPLEAMQDRAQLRALSAQLRLFDARRETLERQQAQLSQRRRQADAELAGLAAQRLELEAEAEILREQLDNQRELRARGLTASSQVSELSRSSARLQGSRAALDGRRAELLGLISEIEAQGTTMRAARREEAEEQFSQTGLQLIELRARRTALAARLDALELRAPVAGAVHGLSLPASHTVLRPAEVVMEILSTPAEPLLIVRVSPDEIDHIRMGQRAYLRFPALAARNLPDLPGQVINVSGATFVDDRTGVRHFRVQIVPLPEALATVPSGELVPGMSVQAFIATGVRTPLAYLLGPIREHFARALREP